MRTRANRKARPAPERHGAYPSPVSPFWVWTQALIVLFVVLGIVIAAVRLG
jgi:hypothetical protein